MNTRKMRMATLVLAIGMSGTAQAALHDRGGGLIYDDVLDVTWLQDANYANTSGYDADGQMTWSEANAWAENLSYFDTVRNVSHTNWRLPTVSPVNGTNLNYTGSNAGTSDVGYNITSPQSELAYMYYVDLVNHGYFTNHGTETRCHVDSFNTCLDNVGPFVNVKSDVYWYGTDYAPLTEAAFGFNFGWGAQGWLPKDASYYAWAVRDGDVAAVPEPETYTMMLAGLALVSAMVRRRKCRNLSSVICG